MVRRIGMDETTLLDLPGRQSREVVAGKTGAAASTFRIVDISPEADGFTRGPHVHDGFEEIIHVISGSGVIRTDGHEIAICAGDTLLVPSGERHASSNSGTEVLRLLCFFPVADIGPGTREFADWTDSADD